MPARQRLNLRFVLMLALITGAIVASSSPSGGRLVAEQSDARPTGLRVFYTGHSFHMFVPRQVEQIVPLAKIEGHKLVGTQGIGGNA